MKFLVPNYSCLQNLWLGGYRPQIPVFSVLSPQLNLLNPLRTKFLGTPLPQVYILVYKNGIVRCPKLRGSACEKERSDWVIKGNMRKIKSILALC